MHVHDRRLSIEGNCSIVAAHADASMDSFVLKNVVNIGGEVIISLDKEVSRGEDATRLFSECPLHASAHIPDKIAALFSAA